MALPFVPFVSDLDTPLLKLSEKTVFRARDSFGGIHFFSQIGGGKTSSSHVIAGAYLRAGYGGLVTAVQPLEVEQWKRYAREHGREKSLVLFDENEGFNFLSYMMALHGMEGIGTVTQCLMRIVEAAKKVTPTGGKSGDNEFFESSTRMTLRYAIAPLYAAYGEVTIRDIIRFISSAPKSRADVASKKWQQSSFLYRTMSAALGSPKVRMGAQGMKNMVEFWSGRYVDIPDKTRGNIEITVGTVLDRFLHGRLAQVFCGKTTIVPELSFDGAVIVLAMPTLTWGEDGTIAQQLSKFLWQRAVLSRNSLEEKYKELFCSSGATKTRRSRKARILNFYLSCRQSKCAVVSLTQSLPSYYAKLGGGGDNGRDAAHALVGKYTTHVYGANGCPETNEFAAKMLGRVMTRRGNYSAGSSKSVNVGMNAGNSENSGSSSSYGSSYGSGTSVNNGSGSTSGSGNSWGETKGRGTSNSESRGYSESMEYAIEPGDFGRVLKTGGPRNNNIVTAIWYSSGRVFEESGTNWLLVRFRQ